MDPNVFARNVLRAVQRNRAIIIEPAWWRLFWWADRLFPRFGERLGETVLRRILVPSGLKPPRRPG
ncbi:MAG: hypothetical protein E6J77_12295 [Deltaproteobacteria bacterium]|nr:MAG: hypothetical protein E6J77_12295 [Deltaproteobacteria bacterium]